MDPEQALTHPPAVGREQARQTAVPLVEVPVGLRDDPGRCALEDGECGDPVDDGGYELDGAGTGADDRDPFARQVHVVAPGRRVEDGSAEGLHAGQVGLDGMVQRSHRGDQEPGAMTFAGRGGHLPAALRLDPAGAGDLAAEPHTLDESAAPGHVTEVVQDLRLAGEQAAPVGVLVEGVRVQRGRDVTSAPGIGVVAPGPAQVVRGLQDQTGADARLPQHGRDTEPAETGAHDHDVDVPVHGARGCGGPAVTRGGHRSLR
jgi:hypothetical protein